MAYGEIYGFAFSAFQIDGALASSAVSASRDSYGSYTPAMLTLAVGCVICAGFFMCLGPYRYDTAHG
ncbi:hypothetical protein G3I76_23065 [Streptomyces sp. SID11233]|nr:hypothetical protein [Streptomyces sp. SID11233]